MNAEQRETLNDLLLGFAIMSDPESNRKADALRAALSSAPPDLVALRLVLKCAERACDSDNIDAASDYVREAIRHVDKLAPAPPVAETPPTRERVWTGPGELERTGYIDQPASPVVAPAPVVEHGRTCPKAIHSNQGGYLHGEDDDSPYNVDGLRYCGRCHAWLDTRETDPGGGR